MFFRYYYLGYPETPIVLVTPPGHEAAAKIRLAPVGFDRVLGALEHPVDSFVADPVLVEPLSRLPAAALAGRIRTVSDLVLINVRNPSEVALGTIAGSPAISPPASLTLLDQLERSEAN